jgi:hypothetical protein
VTETQLTLGGYLQLTSSPIDCLKELKNQTELQHRILLYNIHAISSLTDRTTQQELNLLANHHVKFRRAETETDNLLLVKKIVLRSNELHSIMQHPELEKLGMASTYHINRQEFNATAEKLEHYNRDVLDDLPEEGLSQLLKLYRIQEQ